MAKGLILRGKTWHIDATIKGHRIRQSTGVENKGDAEDILAKIRLDVIRGQYFPKPQGENKLFCEMMSRFVKEHRFYKGRRISENTRSSYANSLKHLLPVFANTPLAKIASERIRKYLEDREKEGAAGSTLNRERSLLSAAFNEAINWNWIDSNPCRRVERLPENERVKYLSKEESERLFNALPQWLKPIATVAQFTGLRISSILELTWDKVDLFRKVVIIGKTKNGDPLGLPMNQTVFELFKTLNKVRHLKSNLVFLNSWGGKRHRQATTTAFKKACREAGFNDFHFHDMRHDFASQLVMNGVDIYSVSALLGHRSVKTTEKYAHLSPEKLRADICVLDGKMTQNSHIAKTSGD